MSTSSPSLRVTRICAWLFGVSTALYVLHLITPEDWKSVVDRIIAILIASLS